MPESAALDAIVANTRNSRQGASTNRSHASNASNSRQRVLQIKGMLDGGIKSKPRFNEDVEDETRSIRQESALKGGVLNSMKKRSSMPELTSQISGAVSGISKSVRSR